MDLISEKIFSILKLAQELETKPKKYGTDVLLTATEIHLIEIIGQIDDSSVTNIAKKAGVTKGAVSQKLQKLEDKGLIIKEVAPDNQSKSLIKLNSKGKAAFFSHKHWHEEMDGGFNKYYESLDKEKYEIITEFLDRMEDLLKRLASVED